MSMRQTTLALGNCYVLFTQRKVTSARQVIRCCTTDNPPLGVDLGQRKTHANSHRHETMHRGKVELRVNELPWGNELSLNHVNELSLNHVNRPLVD